MSHFPRHACRSPALGYEECPASVDRTFPPSKVDGKHARVDSEIVRERTNHLAAQVLLPRKNFGDRRLGDQRFPEGLSEEDFWKAVRKRAEE